MSFGIVRLDIRQSTHKLLIGSFSFLFLGVDNFFRRADVSGLWSSLVDRFFASYVHMHYLQLVVSLLILQENITEKKLCPTNALGCAIPTEITNN